jgi:hypothetical protein
LKNPVNANRADLSGSAHRYAARLSDFRPGFLRAPGLDFRVSFYRVWPKRAV